MVAIKGVTQNDEFARGVVQAGIYSCASVISANPIGLIGGAIFGTARYVFELVLDKHFPSEEGVSSANKTNRAAVIFFASHAVAAIAIASLGFSAALMNIAGISLVGLGCQVAYTQFSNLISMKR
ncbi:MAG: hypothetical protein COT85_02725 [Chlamydiae bacterium CG10_big_fil_rev_8_21_14_0_10_42_34]|nr:MAG: hypothetical protein COT85_02725 [Chlamydiae bacterium CG10_big_fil_rev_8_21_14_0_10_42_34]